MEDTKKIIDVAIIGGGVSGTYAGWRLKSTPQFKDKNITIFEGSDRIGGRLLSISQTDVAPNLVAELGGMRFQKNQQSVYNLITHLGMKDDIVNFGSEEDNNYQYVRGKHYFTRDYNDNPEIIPFKLYPRERGKTPAQLQYEAIFYIYPELKGMSLDKMREYLKSATFMGNPLWKVGFWNLLLTRLSNEAYQLIREAGGYYWIISNWNAYDAIPEIVFQYEQPEFYRLKTGFQQLPLKLGSSFEALGGTIQFNQTLIKASLVSKDDKPLIKLKTNKEEVLARRVIFSLPKGAIQGLSDDSFLFSNKQFNHDLETVTAEPADKLFMWFDQEWWTGLGISQGASNTDLPMRQCYYFGSEDNPEGVCGKSGLLMATYNDGLAVDFWSGFMPRSKFSYSSQARFENRLGYHQNMAPPKAMIHELIHQLSVLHQIKVPDPHTAIYQNWSWPPFGGGWHFWNPYNQSWEVIPRIRKPINDVDAYLCGESYSASQGWVEGAINTTEKVLEDYFELAFPSWLDNDYNIGP